MDCLSVKAKILGLLNFFQGISCNYGSLCTPTWFQKDSSIVDILSFKTVLPKKRPQSLKFTAFVAFFLGNIQKILICRTLEIGM